MNGHVAQMRRNFLNDDGQFCQVSQYNYSREQVLVLTVSDVDESPEAADDPLTLRHYEFLEV